MKSENPGMRPNLSLETLQKENELLTERVQRLENMLHHVPAMLYTSDPTHHTVSWCNRSMEEATGFSLQEMNTLGVEFFRQLMHPDDFELTGIARQSFKHNKQIFGGVTRMRKKGQDDWRWLVGMAVPFSRDEQGAVKEVICAFLDLTIAMDTDEQLADAMSDVLRRQNETLLSKLTTREKDVLTLAVRGLNNKEIAGQLNLSRYTVETHRKNIRLKLKVRNATELVALARKIGFN
ncbi:LuxR C-terminal-related transcriptional regulator [Chitinophaga japonensis]|uniref:RNA polymerase sigma factor (Sigma-70 family) n=1 Tax=Chitinophaga japonensis TaxID=104662 RepID=A0A562TES3_CHIJA|nr:LuxR C-terminal-related transcriptional regulator [Chitinophaga japonensis]TWI92041.1 RNA polymerase sigma factor (sigma-70 family) [Chitinophaga japonensis]